MRCDELRRWLDEGMESGNAERARAHAASCPSCARELAAAVALERALGAAPPSPPSGGDAFVARVLERIEGTAPFPAPARPALAGRSIRLGWNLLAEPGFMAAAAMLFALVVLAPFFRSDSGGPSVAVAASVLAQALGSLVGSIMGALGQSLAPASGLHPVASVTLYIAFGAPLLWAGFWGVGAVDRW